jgi:hypothetical protein
MWRSPHHQSVVELAWLDYRQQWIRYSVLNEADLRKNFHWMLIFWVCSVHNRSPKTDFHVAIIKTTSNALVFHLFDLMHIESPTKGSNNLLDRSF